MKQEIKKWFEDNTLRAQKIPLEHFGSIKGMNPDAAKPENQKSNNFIVIKTITNKEGYNCQVVIQNTPIIGNIYYMLFFFDNNDVFCGLSMVEAASTFPPVYEKCFGLDYFDYIKTQEYINNVFKTSELSEIEIDRSYDNKFIYVSPEGEEAFRKYKNGEQYEVLAVMAKAWFEKAVLKEVKKL